MKGLELAERILPWYFVHRRSLPWRDHPDPYAVWISETMLQQTRVDTVLAYYLHWMERFPDVASLAAAALQDVLNAWEGLGYYRRARSLHQAAGIIARDHGGKLPSDRDALLALPGIGRYTAGAIASLAFNRDEPAVDGNVRRVLARVFDIALPAGSAAAEKAFWELARHHLPAGRARDFNQALMELGALVCTPQRPDCESCPLADECEARALGLQLDRPVRRPRRSLPHITVTAAVCSENGRFLITRRPADGLLGGLWEFPGGKLEPGESLEDCLRREIDEEIGVAVEVLEPFGVYKHAYSHFKVTLHAFTCRIWPSGQRLAAREVAGMQWVARGELDDYPMGKIDRQIAMRLQAAG